MSTRGMRGPHAFRVLFLLTAVGISSSCWAVVINFENPPYTVGPVLGQDGWVKPGYVGPGFDVNGTANISTTGPLSGAQSLAYVQTTAAAGTGASDVVKSEVISVPGGVAGTDLTVSYLMTASGNGVNPTGVAGLYLSSNAVGGSSPLFARLNGAAMEASDTNSIVTIPNFVYFAGDVLQVKYEVDFDAANYVLTVNNMTTNQLEFQKTLGYLAPFTPEGPNGEYLIDVGLLLRGGSASSTTSRSRRALVQLSPGWNGRPTNPETGACRKIGGRRVCLGCSRPSNRRLRQCDHRASNGLHERRSIFESARVQQCQQLHNHGYRQHLDAS